MKKLFGAIVLIVVGVVGWRIGSNLSSDAIGMGVGMLLGILAGIPTALLVLASSRRGEEDERPRRSPRHESMPHPMAGYSQPPVIVITGQGNGMPQSQGGQQTAMPDPMMWQQPAQPSQRQFRIVGEQDGWIEE